MSAGGQEAPPPDVLAGLTLGERKDVSARLAAHHDEEVFVLLNQLCVDRGCKKKGQSEERIVVVGSHRLYTFRHGKCAVVESLHITEIAEVASGEPPTQVSITKHGEKQPCLVVEALAESDDFLAELYLCAVETHGGAGFPGVCDDAQLPTKFLVAPASRLDREALRADAEENVGPCGGFSRTYLSYCDVLRCAPLSDFLFDVDELWPFNAVTAFDLGEVTRRKDRLSPHDQRVMIHALEFNPYFTKLALDDTEHAPKEAVNQLALTLGTNSTIEHLSFQTCGLDKGQLSAIADSLGKNAKSKVHTIDVSGNQAGDPAVEKLAAAIKVAAGTHGLRELAVARTCGKGGMGALPVAIIAHVPTQAALLRVDISGNKVDDTAAKSWGAVLGRCQKIEEFRCSDTNMSMKALATGFGQSKMPALRYMNVSGNPMVKDKGYDSLVAVLLQAPLLTDLDLQNTGLDAAALAGIFGPSGLKTLVHARVGNNALGDAGLLALLEAIEKNANSSVTAIHLENVFAKKSKQRGAAVEALTQFFARPQNKVTTLSLAETGKGGLKADVVPFFFSLMMNATLKSLDVSGNSAGQPLALAMSKMLMTNRTIEELRYDGNGFDLECFRMVRMGVMRNAGALVLLPLPLQDAHEALKSAGSTADTEALHKILGDIQSAIQQAAVRSAEDRGKSLRGAKHTTPTREASTAPSAGKDESNGQEAAINTKRASVLWATKETVAEMEGLTEEEREQMGGVMRTATLRGTRKRK